MLGFQGKASQLFSSIFFFFFFSLSFSFRRLHWTSFIGNHNLLQVVNETKVGLHDKRVMQFLKLLQKTDVHSVWLAKGGRND